MENHLYDILNMYGFAPTFSIAQIDNKSVWQIEGEYILKKNDEEEKDIKKLANFPQIYNMGKFSFFLPMYIL